MHVAAMTQAWEHQLAPIDIARAMQRADELGFHRAMLGEHFVIPDEHIALSGDHYLHSSVALAFIAGHTKNILLTPSISLLPLQNPIVQAKAWATLDWLSNGRAVPNFGVGWLKEEFDILRVPFEKRGEMAEEYIQAMIALWSQDKPSFKGDYVEFDNVGFSPKPVQKPYPPIWFGGDAPAVLRRIARFANGWMPFQTPPENFPKSLEYIRSQPEFDGRHLDVFFALEMLNVGAQHEVLDDPRAPGNWDSQKIIDQCGWLNELGVTETIVPLPPLDGLELYLERLQWVAEEIMPKIR
jgi:probable F420-dependent oxidoreductase